MLATSYITLISTRLNSLLLTQGWESILKKVNKSIFDKSPKNKEKVVTMTL